MISVTFEHEENANWPLLLHVGVAGDGSTTTNIKMNTKWLRLYLLDNDETRPFLTQPLHHLDEKFFVMISVTFECEGQTDCPFLLQVDVAGDGSTTTNIKMNTKWLYNTSRPHPTSTPLHDKYYAPFLLQIYVAGDWNGSTRTNIKINTK
jgi:hypothetical protein